MSEPFFTIFAAGRNCAASATKCIQSVLAQDFADWELLVVDDASTDGTFEAAKEAGQRDPRITFISNGSRRFKAANFYDWLPKMRGEVIAELDLDDWLLSPTYLSTLHALYAAGADAVVGQCPDQPSGRSRGLRMWAPDGFMVVRAPRSWRWRLSNYFVAKYGHRPLQNPGAPPAFYPYSADIAICCPAVMLADIVKFVPIEPNYHVNREGPEHDFPLHSGEQNETCLKLMGSLREIECQIYGAYQPPDPTPSE